MLVIMCIGQWKQSAYKSFQFQVPSAVTLPATSMRLLAPLIMVSLTESPKNIEEEKPPFIVSDLARYSTADGI